MTKQIEFTGRLLDYKEFTKYSNTFIETGNAAGDGLQRAIIANFRYVLGIEAKKMYYDMCISKFKNCERVQLFLGTSVDNLNYLLNMFTGPAVIFLDAHVSGETSFGYDDWIKNGEESEAAQDKTIKAELAIILAHSNKHVIIIDDVNGVTDGHAYEYCEILLAANPEYKFYFYDENLSGSQLYKDKLLVAIA